jgi:hypothetical protein
LSKVERLTLNQYVTTMNFLCESQHKKCCEKECKSLAKVAINILEDGFMLLKDAFLLCSPIVTYTALHARRKLLRMPLVAIGVGNIQDGTFRYFLVEKGTVNYTMFQGFANKFLLTSKNCKENKFFKDNFKKLLQIAETDAERERLKFVPVKAC